MKRIGLSLLLVVSLFSVSFAQESGDYKTTIANQVQALGQCQKTLGSALGQVSEYQAAMLRGELVSAIEAQKAFVQKFETANPGKTLDTTLKVVEKEKEKDKK